MSVRRDQVDAQKYVNRRLTNALLTSDANTPESPLRSVGRATIVSAVIGALVVLGFLAYGFVSRGGNTDWQEEGAVVVARESGTRFVYLAGLLHPVANLTSARLIAGGDAEVVYVSENSIAAAARGEPLGILGAPDTVPELEQLVHDDWSACSALVELESGAIAPSVQVAPGVPEPRVELRPEQAVLVEVDGNIELIWDRARWPIEDLEAVLTAFNAPAVRPYRVGAAWGNVVTAARGVLELPDIVERGAPAGVVGRNEALVGQVFVVDQGEAGQYYVAYPDGLVPISDPVAALVLADPRTSALYGGGVVASPIDAATVNTVGLSSVPPIGAAVPDVMPDLINDNLGGSTGLCITYPLDPAGSASVSVVEPLQLGAPDGVGLDAVDYVVADSVALEPGHGALVRAAQPDGSATGTMYLVTDQGVKFPLAHEDVLASLGYGGVAADELPRTLLDVIPTGPSLDPAAARSVVNPPTA